MNPRSANSPKTSAVAIYDCSFGFLPVPIAGAMGYMLALVTRAKTDVEKQKGDTRPDLA
ncbi:MAG: hypothetical protein HKN25_14830 [Pyrinomonadaceae bacterium]|nr:hypothetical protein [Pyrinomonadaceae bacterium]